MSGVRSRTEDLRPMAVLASGSCSLGTTLGFPEVGRGVRTELFIVLPQHNIVSTLFKTDSYNVMQKHKLALGLTRALMPVNL